MRRRQAKKIVRASATELRRDLARFPTDGASAQDTAAEYWRLRVLIPETFGSGGTGAWLLEELHGRLLDSDTIGARSGAFIVALEEALERLRPLPLESGAD